MRTSMKMMLSLLVAFGLVACGGGAGDEGDATEADTTAQIDEGTEDGATDDTVGGAMTTPSWMTVDEAARTVTMEIDAGADDANNRWNFNGLYAGEGSITVPEGYTVTIEFTNSDPTQPHSLGIGEAMDTYPATFENPQPVFAGAMTSNPNTSGTPSNESETIEFTTDTAGDYAMICYVPGHAVAGMVIPFTVSAEGEAGVTR